MTKTVTLTAGHSNTDPGAVNGSDREADLAQDMRNIVASILRDDYGLTVKTDGTGKGNMPLREAVKLIRGSDVAIEFHTNAAASKAATGVEALSTPKNKRWCQVLSRAVADATGWKLRGDSGFKPDNAGQHSRLAYRKAAYFGMVEFLRLMAMVRPPFIFFSSTRSELPAYLDLVAELHLPGWERFAGSQTLTVSSTINRNSSYDDYLIYKF